MEKLLSLSEEVTPLFNRLLEFLHAEKMKSVRTERYQMYSDWYNRLDDIKLEMAGVLNYKYVNPKWDGRASAVVEKKEEAKK